MALTAGTWRITDPHHIGAQPIADISTTQNHQLGLIVQAKDVGTTAYGSGEFQYCKGVASCAAKNWVGIPSDNYTIVRAVANGNYPLGVAMGALTASYYGWVQISGKALGSCLTQFADNGAVFLTATAGSVDDASVAGDFIFNAVGASGAVVGDLHAEFELNRPFAPQRVSIAG